MTFSNSKEYKVLNVGDSRALEGGSIPMPNRDGEWSPSPGTTTWATARPY